MENGRLGRSAAPTLPGLHEVAFVASTMCTWWSPGGGGVMCEPYVLIIAPGIFKSTVNRVSLPFKCKNTCIIGCVAPDAIST